MGLYPVLPLMPKTQRAVMAAAMQSLPRDAATFLSPLSPPIICAKPIGLLFFLPMSLSNMRRRRTMR